MFKLGNVKKAISGWFTGDKAPDVKEETLEEVLAKKRQHEDLIAKFGNFTLGDQIDHEVAPLRTSTENKRDAKAYNKLREAVISFVLLNLSLQARGITTRPDWSLPADRLLSETYAFCENTAAAIWNCLRSRSIFANRLSLVQVIVTEGMASLCIADGKNHKGSLSTWPALHHYTINDVNVLAHSIGRLLGVIATIKALEEDEQDHREIDLSSVWSDAALQSFVEGLVRAEETSTAFGMMIQIYDKTAAVLSLCGNEPEVLHRTVYMQQSIRDFIDAKNIMALSASEDIVAKWYMANYNHVPSVTRPIFQEEKKRKPAKRKGNGQFASNGVADTAKGTDNEQRT